METYVSKVTTAGQITLPKTLRKFLKVEDGSFIQFEKVGDAIVLRKLDAEEHILASLKKKIKKSGVTKEKIAELIEESSKEAWKETYAKDFS
ncbi:MAG: AbrB/MazE/SpoVT family DNA-binding domain-containing protein [Candidatus Thermoplasmatota archaeon]|nr:AbrB/MazE/SpoVT family DNA-binding domain-containing protein [Candidatus Thermoplasmatota archaeon]